MPDLNKLIVVRNATLDDLSLISDALFHATNSKKSYVNNVAKYLVSSTIIACNINDNSQIFAFLSGKNNFINFIYTKLPFRKLGISKLLILHKYQQNTPIYYTINCSVPFFMPKLKYSPLTLLNEVINDANIMD
jgi:hypothetical protein